MVSTCKDVTTPNTMWNFCPAIAPAYLLTVLFVLTTIVHLVQAIYYRKPYCWVIVLSGLAQTLCYIFRVLSILHPENFGDYVAWFVLILVAPLFTNAFVYMVMGRMVWNYNAAAKIFRITAWRFGAFFVVLDIFALIIQIVGAASASGNNESTDRVLRGLHIYMLGVGIQQFFIIVFFVFALKFHQTYLAESRQERKRNSPLPLLYTLYAVLLLITLRIIFRLCEYAQGLDSKIPNNEAYQYCLDTLPMLLALILLNIIHPGRVMAGKECSIPGRKERKSRNISNKADQDGSGEDLQVIGA